MERGVGSVSRAWLGALVWARTEVARPARLARRGQARRWREESGGKLRAGIELRGGRVDHVNASLGGAGVDNRLIELGVAPDAEILRTMFEAVTEAWRTVGAGHDARSAGEIDEARRILADRIVLMARRGERDKAALIRDAMAHLSSRRGRRVLH